MRSFSRPLLSVFIAAACTLTVEAAAPAPKSLLPVQEVLGRIEQVNGDSPSGTPARSEAARLVKDLERYRAESASLADTIAADRWLELFDRARGIGETAGGDLGGYYLEVLGPVGVKSVSAMTSLIDDTGNRSSSATTWLSEVRMFCPTSTLPV